MDQVNVTTEDMDALEVIILDPVPMTSRPIPEAAQQEQAPAPAPDPNPEPSAALPAVPEPEPPPILTAETVAGAEPAAGADPVSTTRPLHHAHAVNWPRLRNPTPTISVVVSRFQR